MWDEAKIARGRERRKKKKGEKDLHAVTVEGMKEGARASLFRKLKKSRNGHSGNDGREREGEINARGEKDRRKM